MKKKACFSYDSFHMFFHDSPVLNLHKFDFFLFDFDGLLVNTEELHYRAYVRALAKRGFELPWDFEHYCTMAHYGADLLAQSLYTTFPQFATFVPSWDEFYKEKRSEVAHLFDSEKVTLMPGVKEMLSYLSDLNKRMCVVTHSPKELIDLVYYQHDILKKIPYWVTRERYTKPKPHPEGYLYALNEYGQGVKSPIGFEDTPRGIESLFGTTVQPVLITSIPYPEIPDFKLRGVIHYPTFNHISKK